MQDKNIDETKGEHIVHIILTVIITAIIAFGLGCYTGSTAERSNERSFYNKYIKPVADSERDLIQNLGNNLKRCQDNLAEYRKVTMTSNAAQYDSMVVALKAKHNELQHREKLLQEDLVEEMVKGANLQKENYSLKRELEKRKLKEDLLHKKQ